VRRARWRPGDHGRETSCAHDKNGDGKADERWHTKFDERGNQRCWGHDANGDGRSNESSRFEYDGRGLLWLEEHDRSGDGKIDERTQYVYDENGNALVIERLLSGRRSRQVATYDCVSEILERAPKRVVEPNE
jgi:hypothetical protein